MRTSICGIIGLAFAVLAACSPPQPRPSPELAWAYPAGKDSAFPPHLTGPQQATGSAITLTPEQVGANPPDWFPADHPPAPPSVAQERKGAATACAECHMIDGQGFPGSTDLAGFPAAYIVEQVHEFKSGQRRSAEAERPDTMEMVKVAETVSEADLAAAAAYYASLPRRTPIRVVETDLVPRTWPDRYGWLNRVDGGGDEPIAGRIIEVAADTHRLLISDPGERVTDYAPTGSIARGAALVRVGGPGGQPCVRCHGGDLRGQGAVPPLAGRGAAYLARMLWDIHTGARKGPTVDQMQAVTRELTPGEITDITAYIASLKP